MTATHRKIPTASANHNRRQRKKLHIGEYKQVTLILRVELNPELTELEIDVFVDRFVVEVLDKRNLNGFGIIGEYFSVTSETNTVTQDDVDMIEHWLKHQSEVLGATGEIQDAWYC